MAVVALIPTGKLEHAALCPALARLFPDDRFVVRPAERNLDGFTSRDVASLATAAPGPVPNNLDEPLIDRQKRYRETRNGVAALELLNWECVLRSAPHCPFLHAFLDDLGEALNSSLSFIDRAHTDVRARFPAPGDRILRNL